MWKTSSEDSKLEALRAELAALTRMDHQIIRQSCIGTDIDAESLILKLPPFTADVLKPGGIDRRLDKIKSVEGLTIEELGVYQGASETVTELIWQRVKKKYSNLPEFSD